VETSDHFKNGAKPKRQMSRIIKETIKIMNENIKVRKFVFDDKNTSLKLSNQEKSIFLKTNSIEIQILEIEADNPSDLILVVKKESSSGDKVEEPLYLFLYRDKMLFQNNKYIMRLDYVIDNLGVHFEIDVVSESQQPFKLSAYYSIN